MKPLTKTSKRLRSVRIKLDLTWSQFAKRIGISLSQLYKALSGDRELGELTSAKLLELEIQCGLVTVAKIPPRIAIPQMPAEHLCDLAEAIIQELIRRAKV